MDSSRWMSTSSSLSSRRFTSVSSLARESTRVATSSWGRGACQRAVHLCDRDFPQLGGGGVRGDERQRVRELLCVQVQARETELDAMPQERALLRLRPLHLLATKLNLLTQGRRKQAVSAQERGRASNSSRTCRAVVSGMVATASMTVRTSFAVFALGSAANSGRNSPRRPRSAAASRCLASTLARVVTAVSRVLKSFSPAPDVVPGAARGARQISRSSVTASPGRASVNSSARSS